MILIRIQQKPWKAENCIAYLIEYLQTPDS